MNAYYSHLLSVTRRMYELDAAYALEILAPNTVYPHVPPSALIDPAPENRRGAPRRVVAVQSGSYGLPYLNNQNQTNSGGAVYHPNRNDSGSRGVNNGVDTPNKRRRVQNPPGGVGTTHLHPRGGDPDTDDYSTPRRGVAALDAEAYRPGGNTASRARTQNRKKEGKAAPHSQNQAPLDPNLATNADVMGMVRPGSALAQAPMTGVDQGFIPSNAPPPHKNQSQNGRSRNNNSQQGHRGQNNANPPPQQYAMHYPPGYEDKQMLMQAQDMARFVEGANMNRNMGMNRQQMEATAAAAAAAAYQQHQSHHGAMNMNPNLNHMPGMGYPVNVGMGMGMVALPPPPSSTSHNMGQGRPPSGSISRSNYDGPPASSGGGNSGSGNGSSRQAPGGNMDAMGGSSHGGAYTSGPKVNTGNTSREMAKEREQGSSSSASGGLMPVPMMTSLPPVTSLAHGHQSSNTPLGLSGSGQHSALIGDTGPKSRRYSQSGYTNYANSDTQGGNMGSSYGNSHSNYQPSSNSNPPRPSSASLYNNHNGPTSREDKVPPSRSDMHPSLSTSNSAPGSAKEGQSGFNRDVSGPASAGSGSGALHASLARDPPFRVNSAGDSDRTERDGKGGYNRSRAGTTTNPPDMGDKDYGYNAPPSGEREGDGGYSRHPSLHISASGGPNMIPSSGGRYPYSSKESAGSMKGDDETDRRGGGITSPDTGGRRSANLDHIIDDPKEWRFDKRGNKRSGETGTGTATWGDAPMVAGGVANVKRSEMGDGSNNNNAMDIDPKGTRTPVRGGGGGGGTDGETIEDDQKPYCICGQPSYGQMIGCDDSECEYEWVS
jgi:hypothetical protein